MLDFSAAKNVTRLENGLTIIHQEIAATPVVVADVWVRAGATSEPESWLGMAHFLEHMIFKGTQQLPPGMFDQIVEGQGGVSNAATSHDYAHFYLTTANQHFETALPVLGELLLNAEIAAGEFQQERQVVLEEIRQAEDDPNWIEFQVLIETLYGQHPYSRSILGTPEQLHQRHPSEMRCFHRCHYQPQNMAVVIVGGIEKSQATDLAQATFGAFPTPETCPDQPQVIEPLPQKIRRRYLSLPQIESPRLTLAWAGPGIDQIQDAYGLDLLAVVLSEGRTARLVQCLREELQLVHDISSHFSLQQTSSFLTVNAHLEGKQIETVEALICQEIERLQTQPISATELSRAQRLLCNDYAFSTETPAQLAGLYGYYFTVAQPEMALHYPEKIKTLQPQDLQRIAQQYLKLDDYAVVVVEPG
ncbi:MAG: M16 family metallopeptidase [Microcoleaceae cyanobacterium]